MYATELRLQNFKRFADLTLDLSSSITLLLGPNSSGKSSVVKALLGLKQTASPANEHEVFSAQGEYADLGIYRDFVFEHKIDGKVRLGLHFAASLLPLRMPANSTTYVELAFGRDVTTEQARLLEVQVTESSYPGEIALRLTKKLTRETYQLTLGDRFARALVGDTVSERGPEFEQFVEHWTRGLSVRVGDRYQLSAEKSAGKSSYLQTYPILVLANAINGLLRTLDRDFFYIGPLRRSPSRSYSRTAHLLSVGASGEHTPSVLANLKSRASRERTREREQAKRLDQLTGWVDSIFPGRVVDSKTLEELVKLEIGRDSGGKEVISDVGFGFSQVLPILVQAAVMPANTTLLIEQPELHLHPQAQTKLAEVFVEASASGRRFLIETHSEHFVRGLQLAVSNGTAAKGPTKNRLKATDVRFIYVPRAPQSPKQMPLDIWGQFTEPWPAGFFDEAYQVTMKLLQNKIATSEKIATSSRILTSPTRS